MFIGLGVFGEAKRFMLEGFENHLNEGDFQYINYLMKTNC